VNLPWQQSWIQAHLRRELPARALDAAIPDRNDAVSANA
jgi:hypothetical protein